MEIISRSIKPVFILWILHNYHHLVWQDPFAPLAPGGERRIYRAIVHIDKNASRILERFIFSSQKNVKHFRLRPEMFDVFLKQALL
jgi:hypothetical protein